MYSLKSIFKLSSVSARNTTFGVTTGVLKWRTRRKLPPHRAASQWWHEGECCQWRKMAVKRQVLTRKGAASRSARPPSSSPGWSRHSRCCLGGARWSTVSWHGCCCGSRGGAAGATSPQNPLRTPVWLDRKRSYRWSSPRWSWGGRGKNRYKLLQSKRLWNDSPFHYFLESPFSWELSCWNI